MSNPIPPPPLTFVQIARSFTKREVLVLVIALILAGTCTFLYLGTVSDRRMIIAESTLTNCQQIEKIKQQIRATLAASLKNLPDAATKYYQDHPKDLARARQSVADSLNRFKPIDCYNLPVVRTSKIRRPAGS